MQAIKRLHSLNSVKPNLASTPAHDRWLSERSKKAASICAKHRRLRSAGSPLLLNACSSLHNLTLATIPSTPQLLSQMQGCDFVGVGPSSQLGRGEEGGASMGLARNSRIRLPSQQEVALCPTRSLVTNLSSTPPRLGFVPRRDVRTTNTFYRTSYCCRTKGSAVSFIFKESFSLAKIPSFRRKI